MTVVSFAKYGRKKNVKKNPVKMTQMFLSREDALPLYGLQGLKQS